jgi:hypothetical protein
VELRGLLPLLLPPVLVTPEELVCQCHHTCTLDKGLGDAIYHNLGTAGGNWYWWIDRHFLLP